MTADIRSRVKQELDRRARAAQPAYDEIEAVINGEPLDARLERLQPLTASTRYALTEEDVIYDWRTGRNRYAERSAA